MGHQYAHNFINRIAEQDRNNIFFIYEVVFNVSMRARGGRAPVGQQATITVANSRIEIFPFAL